MSAYISTGSYTFVKSVTGANGSFIKAMVAEGLTSNVIDIYLMVPDEEYTQMADVNGVLLDDVNGVNLYALAPGGTINEADFQRGDQVKFWADFDAADPYLTMYVDSIERLGLKSYVLHCTSSVGLLQDIQHLGGMYSGVAFKDILADILKAEYVGLSDDIYSYRATIISPQLYSVKKDVGDMSITGHLPIASARDNIMQLLFASGSSLYPNRNGNLSFIYDSMEYVYPIPSDQIYIGARVEYSENVTSVTVREHDYITNMTITPEVLYKTSSLAADHEMVVFDKPCHDLAVDGTLVINESNCNYAIVTGNGTLTGIPYVHTTIDFTDTTGKAGAAKEVIVSDMTLVSQLNSENTLNRMVNYYANAELVRMGFELSWYNVNREEIDKCGNFYSFTHPYTAQEVIGCLKEFEVNFSSFAKADAKLVSNWVPKYLGNTYDSSLILTSADLVGGAWIPPAELQGKSVRLVMFSGAQGGQGGFPGQSIGEVHGTGDNNHGGWWYDDDIYIGGAPTNVVSGGAGGRGGAGGNAAAKIIEAIVTLGASHTVSFGAGGIGGQGGTQSSDPEDGALGAHSTFDSYDTDNGTDFSGTYVDLLTGVIIATHGDEGIAGGRGGNGGYSDRSLDQGQAQAGESVGANTGGTGGAGNTSTQKFTKVIGGGGGGGAAAGANGSNGASGGTFAVQPITNSFGDHWRLYYAGAKSSGGVYSGVPTGGDGASAVTVPAQSLYKGGTGGAGGGGAGGCGQPLGFISLQDGRLLGVAKGGTGGNGGQGGQGSDGFAIIYYKA